MFRNKLFVQGNPNVKVPIHSHFGKYILDHLRGLGDAVAIENVESDEKITNKEITQHAAKMAVALFNLGVRPGDVVALGSENHIKFASSILGVILTGATITILGLDIGKGCLEQKIKISSPKYFLCNELFWEKYGNILSNINPDIVSIRIKELNFPEADIDVELFEPLPVRGNSDTAIINYSSGTTGTAKGIQITHLSCILACNTQPDSLFCDESIKSVYLRGCLEYFGTLSWTFKFLILGKKVIYITNESRPETQVMAFEKGQVNVAILFTTQLNSLVKPDFTINGDLQCLSYVYPYGSKLHAETAKKLQERIPSVKHVLQCYGMTEVGFLTSGEYGIKGPKLGSVGCVYPGVTLKVEDSKTKELLGPYQQGEICVKGPSVTKGYISHDISICIDNDGWFRTGDIGYYDEDGYFYLSGRIKEIIKCSSVIVSPLELESILQTHPGVIEAGVVGKPHPIHEEVPAAFVVRQHDSDVTEQELVSPPMQLKGGLRFVPELPKNERGKVLRRNLVEMLNNEA